MGEGLLHITKQSLGYGEEDCHRAQIVQDLVPLINTNPLLSAGYGGEDLPEVVLLVWGQ